MVKATGKERRQTPRAKRVLSIEFALAKTTRKTAVNKQPHLSTTQDMSLGGLSFYTEYEYKKGDILNLHVVMSGILDIFKGQGKIVRVDKKRGNYFLIGIEFLDKPKRSRSAKSYGGTTRKVAAKKKTTRKAATRL